ncbi:MAG: tetratricopeptide repeat protein [Pyrinomonadaceae bacterium]|nr:tetratricopeptide repeat protein [Pyrinomonadaceae bacterium]
MAIAAFLVCLWLGWSAARRGASRLLSDYGVRANRLDAANAAVKLTPSDAEAHYARALVLAQSGMFSEAGAATEHAVALRPRDYVLWVELGQDRDQIGDVDGALTAFKEAVRLAPFYAQPRWQLGNLFLRTGRSREAFTELRRAALSDPSLWPQLIDLAWSALRGDAGAVRQVIEPQTPDERLALARYFAKKGKALEAVELFHGGGGASEEDVNNLMSELLAGGMFKEAYEVWRSAAGAKTDAGVAVIVDGSFEGRILRENHGFGWQLARDVQGVTSSLDLQERRSGARSLQLDFNGASDPSARIVSQLGLVEPNSSYRLLFAARSEELVTGGPPVIAVLDANANGLVLAESTPLPQGTSDWMEYEMMFNTSDTTSAVLITLQRQGCSSGPCPVFGRVWLDDFSLRKQ